MIIQSSKIASKLFRKQLFVQRAGISVRRKKLLEQTKMEQHR